MTKITELTPDRTFFQALLTGREFELMTLASDLGVEDLKTACEDSIIASLNVENACKFLISAMDKGE